MSLNSISLFMLCFPMDILPADELAYRLKTGPTLFEISAMFRFLLAGGAIGGCDCTRVGANSGAYTLKPLLT